MKRKVKEAKAKHAKAKKQLNEVFADVCNNICSAERRLNEVLEKDLKIQRLVYHSQCFVGNDFFFSLNWKIKNIVPVLKQWMRGALSTEIDFLNHHVFSFSPPIYTYTLPIFEDWIDLREGKDLSNVTVIAAENSVDGEDDCDLAYIQDKDPDDIGLPKPDSIQEDKADIHKVAINTWERAGKATLHSEFIAGVSDSQSNPRLLASSTPSVPSSGSHEPLVDVIEYRSDDITKNCFFDFSVLDTMYRWSIMKNIHSPNWMGIGSWGPRDMATWIPKLAPMKSV